MNKQKKSSHSKGELLSPEGLQQREATLVLLKFELLLNGTLGDWNLPLVSFEIKEGMKPYHGRPYLIPHKHKPSS
jgi:hypothetical protein